VARALPRRAGAHRHAAGRACSYRHGRAKRAATHRRDEDAQAFFAILDGQLKTKGDEPVAGAEAASIALEIIDIIRSHLIVGIWSNEVAQNDQRNAIDHYFFDFLRDEQGIDLPVEVLDDLEPKIMDLARAGFAA